MTTLRPITHLGGAEPVIGTQPAMFLSRERGSLALISAATFPCLFSVGFYHAILQTHVLPDGPPQFGRN